jgi:hypothetical protein
VETRQKRILCIESAIPQCSEFGTRTGCAEVEVEVEIEVEVEVEPAPGKLRPRLAAEQEKKRGDFRALIISTFGNYQ